MATALIPGTNERINIPNGATPEVVDRMVKSFQHFRSENPQTATPQVPVTADEQTPDPNFGQDYDPSEHDSWMDWAAKEAGSFVRGAGRNLAGTGDFVLNAVEKGIVDPYFNLPAGRPVSKSITEPGGYREPFTNWFEGVAPPLPVGEDYSSAQETGEVWGVPTLTNLGKNTLKSVVKSAAQNTVRGGVGSLVKDIPGNIVKTAVRTGPEVGLDILGSEGGGAIAKIVGGDNWEMAGQLLGGATTGALQPTGGKLATKMALADPNKTGPTIARIDEINKRLRAAGRPEIPVSIGLAGNPGAGLVEDYLSRAPITGQPSLATRRAQYEGIESGVQLAAEDVRGAPSGGQISPRTIGVKADAMADTANQNIRSRIGAIQDQLEADVGSDTPLRTGAAEAEMQGIINNPDIDEEIKDHARDVLDNIRRNYKLPETGVGPPEPPTYGQVKGRRSRVGESLPKGQRLDAGVRKQAYKGMTEDMAEGAESQGVTDFPERQAETSRLYGQQEAIEPHLRAKGETAAHNALFGGSRRKDIDQLMPYDEHAAAELGDILADAIELRYRGGSAGGPVRPENFDIKKLPEWAANDPEFKAFTTRNNIDAQTLLDNLAEVAQQDVGRRGRYSVPTAGASASSGTAANASPINNLASIFGALGAGGALASGQGMMTAAAAPLISSAANYLLSKGASSDKIARSILQPKSRSLPSIMTDALKGATVTEGWNSSAREEEARRKRIKEETIRAVGGR